VSDRYPNYPGAQDRDTSQAAAAEIAPSVSRLRTMVFAYIEKTGDYGATDQEVEDALRLGQNTSRPRRVELMQKGYICDSGVRRLNRSGRKAAVWVVKK